MGIYKSYDIRGIWDSDWDASTAYAIGRELPALLAARRIAVGRDERLSSPDVFRALARGVTEAGCDVVDIGPCDTPAVYFATAFYDMDGSVMITASHNSAEYNGLKVSRARAVPVGYDTGLAELERAVSRAAATGLPKPPTGPDVPPPRHGSVIGLDIRADYLAHLARFRSDLSRLKVVVDCSDGMAGPIVRDVIAGTGGEFVLMYDTPDGRFPHHPPNPLVEANLASLKARVIAERADLGICFDGDADRVMFVDEKARFISPDLIIGLLGSYYFERHPERLEGGSRVVTYDVRSSRSVVERLAALGAQPQICQVGHSYAKKLLRETKGIVGGELAGHYYFRENYFCDSGMIAALIVMECLATEGRPFSQVMDEMRRYSFSGELNFTVPNGSEIVQRVRAEYPNGALTDIDGIRLDFADWWFNLRVSNTEPLLRLVVEAKTDRALEEKKKELIDLISSFSKRATE
jgi:phosphomannomutase